MAVDPDYNSVSLLLHGDGSNGSTTFTDNSPSPKTPTANGNAQISTAQSKWGGAAILFDGTGDYLHYAPSADFDWTGDFTLEAWVYASVLSSGVYAIFGNHNSANDNKFQCYVYADGRIGIGKVGISETTSAAGVITTGSWIHVAVVKNGATAYVYVDGTAVSSGTASSLVSTGTDVFNIGYFNSSNGNMWNGYIDDIRVTKGVARYTSNFTPPTEAFPNSADLMLSGIAVTGAIGAIIPFAAYDLSGAEFVSVGGTTVSALQNSTSGIEIGLAQGSIPLDSSASLLGGEAAISPGTFQDVLSGIWFDITGQGISAATGSVSGSSSVATLGIPTSLQYGIFGVISSSTATLSGNSISLTESQFGVTASVAAIGISATSVFGPPTFIKFAALAGRQIQSAKGDAVGYSQAGISGFSATLAKDTVWPAIGLKSPSAVTAFAGSVFKSGNLVLAGGAVIANTGNAFPKMVFPMIGAQTSAASGFFQHSVDKALAGKLSAVSLNPVEFSSSDIFTPLVGQSVLFTKGEIYIGADEWYNYIRVYAVDAALGTAVGPPVIVLVDEHQNITTLQLA